MEFFPQIQPKPSSDQQKCINYLCKADLYDVFKFKMRMDSSKSKYDAFRGFQIWNFE